ncbi:hypothetical protein [Sporosarcina sp. HYO08]|uniref:hypothetical protein n=1 Tax=Sporosarcina sp. HYO08 TaxID=1759557 RepID=UPI000793C5E4|nr:hypothetical protein [Sporosarcina sp. HYO08]KXH79818.1 hypothetical protein AU377_10055 [Sporosarcina sp. HYO08]
MKFKWKLACIASIIAIFLAACGTDSATNDQPTGQANDPEQSVEEKEQQQDSELEAPEQPEHEKQDDQETAKDMGVKTKSDTQNYTMSVLPGFTLTGEEPGKDIVYSNENDMAFMRIEVIDNNESAYDYAVENSAATLEAASNGKSPDALTSVDLPAGDGIENVKAITVETETGPVSGIVFRRGNAVVKLTIFDTLEQTYLEDFVRMGETIEP